MIFGIVFAKGFYRKDDYELHVNMNDFFIIFTSQIVDGREKENIGCEIVPKGT
jgi:hypothetical protein